MYENLSISSPALSLPPPLQVTRPNFSSFVPQLQNEKKKRQIETYIYFPQFSDGVWVSNLEEEDLSLILTSQNPARIDVRTLRKKKVIIIPTNLLALAL